MKPKFVSLKDQQGTSRVIQRFRLCAGCAGLIPGWGTKIPHATWHSQKIFKSQVKDQQNDKYLAKTTMKIKREKVLKSRMKKRA